MPEPLQCASTGMHPPQSPKWGFHDLAEQPLEYGLKLQSSWINAIGPGNTIHDQSDANARAYESQSNIQIAIIAALNQAIPKRFKCSDTIGAQNYKNN